MVEKLPVVMPQKLLPAAMIEKRPEQGGCLDQVEAPVPWASLSIPQAATILQVHPHRPVSVQVLARSKLEV
jgi:hypothetical protein